MRVCCLCAWRAFCGSVSMTIVSRCRIACPSSASLDLRSRPAKCDLRLAEPPSGCAHRPTRSLSRDHSAVLAFFMACARGSSMRTGSNFPTFSGFGRAGIYRTSSSPAATGLKFTAVGTCTMTDFPMPLASFGSGHVTSTIEISMLACVFLTSGASSRIPSTSSRPCLASRR